MNYPGHSWIIPRELKTVAVNDYVMAFQERGEGIPLVLVHGSVGDYRVWTSQIGVFSRHYRTLAICLRHCFPEPRVGREGNASIQQHAEDLAAFIGSLNAGPVHLIGHSRGGAVALKTAADHRDLVRCAVLADPAPMATILADDPKAAMAMSNRNRLVEKALACIRRGDLDAGLEMFTDAANTPGTWKRLPAAARRIRRDNAWSMTSLVADAQVPFSGENAAGIDAPILLITAENSPAIYGMMHAALEKHLTNFQKTTIPKASHGMHRDNPTAFNTAVLDFLNKADTNNQVYI